MRLHIVVSATPCCNPCHAHWSKINSQIVHIYPKSFMNPQILGISVNFSALLLQLRSLSVYPLEIIPGIPPVPWRSHGDPMEIPWSLGACVYLWAFLRHVNCCAQPLPGQLASGWRDMTSPKSSILPLTGKMRGYKPALVGYKVMRF